jgi:Asp-tRNA(Asn)/Glu-tRNA(Gln) amidotransferase A subunit family amidase
MNADWDTVGPMARTVADVRVLLDVLAGVELASNEPRRRVGVPRQLVPDDDMHPEVAALLGGALEACRRVGVSVVDPVPMPTLPEFDAGAWYRRFRHDLDGYLRAHGDCSPHPDLASIIASGRVHQRYLSRLEEHDGITQAPDEAPEREAMLELKARIRAMFSRAMDEHDLDALVFPTFLHPPKLNGNCDGPLGSTNAWASECSFPAVSVPMGFTGAGLPVGLQLMARPWDERRLLAIAAQFERASGHRRPPP